MQQNVLDEKNADGLITTGVKLIQRVLVSVYHKEGLETLAKAFINAGTQVVSTGSTAARLQELGVSVQEVSAITGFPESLDGRVKTLDPHIHAGILADMNNADHVKQLEELDIKPFDAVIVNLYPFVDTVRSTNDVPSIIEKIDIGGPSMIRAAAKNHQSVAVITDPSDYMVIADRIANHEGFNLAERRYLAAKAFEHTAAYYAAIAQWTQSQWDQPDTLKLDSLQEQVVFTNHVTPTFTLEHTLRYGENPHQQAALYVDPLKKNGLAQAVLLSGKPMSYNNYVDADAAWRAVWDFAPQTTVAICKHNNPCGLAVGQSAEQAYQKAFACDPVSAYGGVVATNTTVTLAMAEHMRPVFTEVLVAPAYEPEALELLRTKKKNLRILQVAGAPQLGWQLKPIDGGVLVQTADKLDAFGDDCAHWTLVSGEAADDATLQDLQFAWKSLRCVKSNAILLAHDGATVGIGMGQVNRVDSCHLAVERANTLADHAERARGAVAASDAFFPFADGAQILIDAGVKAIVQPGGSIRDEEVFEAARQRGVTMYTTGTRHFLH